MANIIEQKTDIFEKVAQDKMISELIGEDVNFKKKKKTSSFESAKKKGKNLIDFMIRLIEALKGKISKVKKKIAEGKKKRKKKIKAIKSSMPPVVETLLINVLGRLLPTMQQKVIDLLMKYLSDNCALDTPNLSLPTGFKTSGLSISSRNLDIFRILKEDINSKVGKIFLGSANTFPAALRSAAVNPNAWVTYTLLPGITLLIAYTSATEKFIFIPDTGVQKLSLKDFFNAMIKKLIPFTAEVFITLACDKLYGVLSKKIDNTVDGLLVQGRGRDDILNDEYIDTIISNYLETDLEDIMETDTFYTFTDDQKALIEHQVNSRFNGEGSFMADCGEVTASIDPDFFFNTMDLFTGATKSSETKIIGQVLGQMANAATTNLPAEDKDTGKKGFFNQIVKLFPVITTKMFLTPDIIFIMEIAKLIKTQQTMGAGPLVSANVTSGADFLQNNSQLMREISKEFYGEIMKELYIIVKEEITKLVIIKVKAIVAEKAKNYLAIITSGLHYRANKALQKVKR